MLTTCEIHRLSCGEANVSSCRSSRGSSSNSSCSHMRRRVPGECLRVFLAPQNLWAVCMEGPGSRQWVSWEEQGTVKSYQQPPQPLQTIGSHFKPAPREHSDQGEQTKTIKAWGEQHGSLCGRVQEAQHTLPVVGLLPPLLTHWLALLLWQSHQLAVVCANLPRSLRSPRN